MNAELLASRGILASLIVFATVDLARSQNAQHAPTPPSQGAVTVVLQGGADGAWLEHVGVGGEAFGLLRDAQGKPLFGLRASLSEQGAGQGSLLGSLVDVRASSTRPSGELVVVGSYVASGSYGGVFRAHVWLRLGLAYAPLVHLGTIDGVYGRLQQVVPQSASSAGASNGGSTHAGQYGQAAKAPAVGATVCPKGRDLPSTPARDVSPSGTVIISCPWGPLNDPSFDLQRARDFLEQPAADFSFCGVGATSGSSSRATSVAASANGAMPAFPTKPCKTRVPPSTDPLDAELAGEFAAIWTLAGF